MDYIFYSKRARARSVVAGLRHARRERRDAVRSPAGVDDVYGAVAVKAPG